MTQLFPARVLATPLPGADAFLHKLMHQRVASQSYAADQDLVDSVRRLLRASVPPTSAKLAAIAEKMGIHERTLERQLIRRGTTFRKVREQLRHEIACQFLEGSGLPIGEIASMLGYSECAAFTRAFARWSGCTPMKWRNDRATPT